MAVTVTPQDYQAFLAMLNHEGSASILRSLNQGNYNDAIGHVASLTDAWLNRAAATGTSPLYQMNRPSQISYWDSGSIAQKAAGLDPRIKEMFDTYLQNRSQSTQGYNPSVSFYLNKGYMEANPQEGTGWKKWYGSGSVRDAYGLGNQQHAFLQHNDYKVPDGYEVNLSDDISLGTTDVGQVRYQDALAARQPWQNRVTQLPVGGPPARPAEFGQSIAGNPDLGIVDWLNQGSDALTQALEGAGNTVQGLFTGAGEFLASAFNRPDLVGPSGVTGIGQGGSAAQSPSWFDPNAYLAANFDVKNAGMNAWDHYRDFGLKEGRQLTPWGGVFDARQYLLQNPDVAAAGMSAVDHLRAYGLGEGRGLPLSDASTYFNGTIANDYFNGTTGNPQFFGENAGTLGPLGFTPTQGAPGLTPTQGPGGLSPTQGPGLSATPGLPPGGVLASTVTAGELAKLIDTEAYYRAREDVRASGMSAADHYLRFGQFENQPLTLSNGQQFGSLPYLAANPDIAAAGMNPLDHLVHFGAAEGRMGAGLGAGVSGSGGISLFPSSATGTAGVGASAGGAGGISLFPSSAQGSSGVGAGFDASTYLRLNPDVQAAGFNNDTAISHFLNFGQKEGRPLTLDGVHFDGAAYLSRNPDVAASGMDPFAHFAAFGQGEGRVGGFVDGTGNAVLNAFTAPAGQSWGGLLSGAFGLNGPQGSAPLAIGPVPAQPKPADPYPLGSGISYSGGNAYYGGVQIPSGFAFNPAASEANFLSGQTAGMNALAAQQDAFSQMTSSNGFYVPSPMQPQAASLADAGNHGQIAAANTAYNQTMTANLTPVIQSTGIAPGAINAAPAWKSWGPMKW